VLSIDYRARRDHVVQRIGNAALVLFSAPFQVRNNDVEHEWRQDSDFHYLSGFDEPESVLVLTGGSDPRFVLFARPRDPQREAWDGPRAGVEGAMELYGADVAHPAAELASRLPELLSNLDAVYYPLGRDRGNDDQVLHALEGVRRLARRGVGYPPPVVDPASVLHEHRLTKSAAEIESSTPKSVDVATSYPRRLSGPSMSRNWGSASILCTSRPNSKNQSVRF
jgi:Xaa-Pro aminopeptidase